MPTMPKRPLGRLGPVSALGFGAMRLPQNSDKGSDVNTDLADDAAVKERARFVHDFTVGEHERADKCVNCGACIEECPQHIAIPEKLAEADKLFRTSAG